MLNKIHIHTFSTNSLYEFVVNAKQKFSFQYKRASEAEHNKLSNENISQFMVEYQQYNNDDKAKQENNQKNTTAAKMDYEKKQKKDTI